METWMYPPLAVLHTELATAAMEYRFERMGPAHARAEAFGYEGLMYPWESALTGAETSPDGDGTHGHCSSNYSLAPTPARNRTSSVVPALDLGLLHLDARRLIHVDRLRVLDAVG